MIELGTIVQVIEVRKVEKQGVAEQVTQGVAKLQGLHHLQAQN